MKPGEFIIDGVSSADSNVWIQSRPVINGPTRRVEYVQSFQMDGDLPFDDEAYNNTELSLSLASIPPGSFLPKAGDIETVNKARQTIYSMFDSGEYRDAQFYFDPNKIYHVMPTEEQYETKRFLNAAMAVSITLSVLPWKHLIGYPKHQISSGVKLQNPTGKIARPIITVTGTGDMILTMNSRSFTMKGIAGSIVLDCDAESAYTVTTNGTIASNQNDKVYTRAYPYLDSGNTSVSWTGTGITKVEIEERWRTLI